MNRKVSPLVLCAVVALGLGSVAGAATRLAAPGHASGMSLGSLEPLAAVGTGFNFQGRLLNGGSPANGLDEFTFAVFDASSGGHQVRSTLTRTSIQVTNGIFVVSLDFGDTAFVGDARWLETAVGPNGGPLTTLSPRTKLNPSPFAIS